MVFNLGVSFNALFRLTKKPVATAITRLKLFGLSSRNELIALESQGLLCVIKSFEELK
jgi:hypothetical protein